MTYCFRCKECGDQSIRSRPEPGALCESCGSGVPVRDYKAESVGFAVSSLARERERGGSSAVRDLFLPTAKDFAGPGDPDGNKGIRQWNDEHDPRPGNSKPMRPEGKREVF